jgi:hypothetical protein
MKKTGLFILLMLLIIWAGATYATTVIPPTFDELVDRAELIFQGSVSDLHSQWIGEGAERRIVTYVNFQAEDIIKGAAGQVVTLRMLGGTVDGRTMEVTDAPKFVPGDRVILFVENNGTQFIPLVGIMHGCFRVKRYGNDFVFLNDGRSFSMGPVLGATQATASAAPIVTAQEFKNAIRAKLQSRTP